MYNWSSPSQIALGILVLVTGWNASRSVMPTRFDRLLPGHAISLDLEDMTNRTRPALRSCQLLFVVHPDCGACRRLAKDSQRLGHPVDAAWISVAGPELTESFADEFAIPQASMHRVGGSSRKALQTLGLVGVPTTILLSDGIVDSIQVGVPLDGSVPFSEACASR